jgi:pimeloyl-ACP methyl ester carboxylesterase
MLSMLVPTADALNPSRTYKQLPTKYNMEYTEHSVSTADGATLNTWAFPAKGKTEDVVLILHNGEGNMADYLRRIDQFRSEYNVVVFDYRGYGESSEFEIDKSLAVHSEFVGDANAMIEWSAKQHGGDVHLYGWGMGAGLALGTGWQSASVRKIIADTPFFSMEDLEERFAKSGVRTKVPARKDSALNVWSVLGTKSASPIDVLLIVGDSDPLYTVKDMQSLQARAQSKHKVYVVENPDRKDNFRVDKAAYMKAINTFLKG